MQMKTLCEKEKNYLTMVYFAYIFNRVYFLYKQATFKLFTKAYDSHNNHFPNESPLTFHS